MPFISLEICEIQIFEALLLINISLRLYKITSKLQIIIIVIFLLLLNCRGQG